MAGARFRDESLGIGQRACGKQARPLLPQDGGAGPDLSVGAGVVRRGYQRPRRLCIRSSAGASDMWSPSYCRRAARWARWGVRDYVNSTSQPFDRDLTSPASSRGADTPKMDVAAGFHRFTSPHYGPLRSRWAGRCAWRITSREWWVLPQQVRESPKAPDHPGHTRHARPGFGCGGRRRVPPPSMCPPTERSRLPSGCHRPRRLPTVATVRASCGGMI